MAKRKQEREQELKDYNTQHGISGEGKNDFHAQLLAMDKNIKPKQSDVKPT